MRYLYNINQNHTGPYTIKYRRSNNPLGLLVKCITKKDKV